jgi:GT2 family glycosyltransferase
MEDQIVLPMSATPRVSIVIVTERQPRLLASCLAAIARCAPPVPFETIVVLNAAVPEVAALVRERVSGVAVVESSVPLGLAGGCNRGREAASGELLVLLHDDAEPQPGWLEGLVAAADAHPEAGAVGSRILHPDGAPQSMGSVLWADGTVWTLGRGAAALVPESATTTAVDYCGSSSLLVRAATWGAVGGADERFYPAFYVDVDLCLGVWKLGQAVLCTPASRSHHHLSSSTSHRLRDLLLRRNRELLLDKRREELAMLEPPAPGSLEGIQRAIARAQERWRKAREAPVSLAAPATPRPPFDPAAQERRVLEIGLGLQRVWAEELQGGLDRALAERDLALAALERERSLALATAETERSQAEAQARLFQEEPTELAILRERAALPATIERGRWWRLYRRLLPLLRFFRRL